MRTTSGSISRRRRTSTTCRSARTERRRSRRARRTSASRTTASGSRTTSILDVNGTTTLTFLYDGPFAQVARNGAVSYQLAWERQINALTWPISVEVQLPGGKSDTFRSDLSIDRRWKVGGA